MDFVPDSYIDTLDRYEVDIASVPALELPNWIDCKPVLRSRYSHAKATTGLHEQAYAPVT
ncbi:hypothetical protein [uncultured Limimaricola sp.]|uniref:hypothetical protein n=1 Tax=uncultured Limimaricola sp. TaxID=2211667 RepID=UPI0030FAF26C